ncbi:MAG: hypothetical protein V3S03_04930 [Vicinamibacteria bacterium]
MHRHFRLCALLILGAALLAPLPACDRNDEAPPPIIVVTPEPVRGVIAQTSFSNYFTGIWVGIEVLVSNNGKVDITVDWTKDETWMFVYFGDTDCSFVQLEGGECPFFIASETKEPKPRVLFTEILEAGLYYLYLYNVPRVPGTEIGSDVTEAVAIQLGLTVFPEQDSGEGEPVRLGRPRVLSPPQI